MIETDDEDGSRELRFSTTTVNLGDGPLIMIGTYDERRDRTRATQRIQTRDGSTAERVAGYFVHHPDHLHWHFEEFTAFELWTYRPGGSLDNLLATTGKMSFCLTDTDQVKPPPPNAAPRATITGCGQERQGISVGWGDTYGASTPGQELDISSVPDGRYAIRSTVDPAERLVEQDDTNNATVVYVEIEEETVQVLPGP